MLSERPLIWLFILATITVDLVLMTVETTHGAWSALKLGLVLGQLAALAIWTVRSRLHRLTRISCLVLTAGLLPYLIDVYQGPTSTWMAFYSGYAFLIILVTIASDLMRYQLRDKSRSEDSVRRWQIPLIEFFGWTIVVAMISFAARHMDFTFLRQETLQIVMALVAVPVLLSLCIRRDLRDLRAFSAMAIALVTCIAAYCVSDAAELGEYVILVQVAFLILWMALLGMDDMMFYAKSQRKPLQELNAIVDKPRLFDPQH